MADTLSIADGVSMDLKQMWAYLQEYFGIPIVLRKEGAFEVVCPYCQKEHSHPSIGGHYLADCEDEVRYSTGIVIGDRSFIPSYGYTVVNYKQERAQTRSLFPII